jgi:hypothetical protein
MPESCSLTYAGAGSCVAGFCRVFCADGMNYSRSMRARGILFVVLTAGLALIAVAAAGASRWVVAVAAAALAIWMGDLARRDFGVWRSR